MTENKRFMVDDAGTLIDMETRNTYDYVSDVCELLNDLHNENKTIKDTIKQAYTNERTQLGKSVLKQLYEAIQWPNGKYKEAEYTATEKAKATTATTK